MKWIKNRLFHNPITSGIGLILIIAAAGYFVWYGRATFESIAAFATSIYFLLKKDNENISDRIKKNEALSDSELADRIDRHIDAANERARQNKK